jgi:hypothetical protein
MPEDNIGIFTAVRASYLKTLMQECYYETSGSNVGSERFLAVGYEGNQADYELPPFHVKPADLIAHRSVLLYGLT